MINNDSLKIEIKFLTPEESYFYGTITDIVAEIHKRTRLYGTCGYVLEPKVAFLFDLEE